MTEDQFILRTREWQQHLMPLGLCHWDIAYEFVDGEVTGERSGLDAEAEIGVSRYYDSAQMNVPLGTLQLQPQHVDRVIVHELLHIAFRDLHNVETDLLAQLEPVALRVGMEDLLEHEVEGLIERLARSIVLLHLGHSGTLPIPTTSKEQ